MQSNVELMCEGRISVTSYDICGPEGLTEAASYFCDIVKSNSPGGRAFKSFSEGVVGTEEGYKARLVPEARHRLNLDDWTRDDIGTGKILEKTISAIEIEEPGIRNNLMEWQGRNGPEANEHSRLLAAVKKPGLRASCEAVLFEIFKGEKEDPELFAEAVEAFGAIYPLLGYLWFLRDPERFVPVRPIGLQKGFARLGMTVKLARQCSWENYEALLGVLHRLRPLIASALNLEEVSLLEAHSFVWVLGNWTLPKERSSSRTRSYGAEEKAAFIMAKGIESTVAHANGQIVERTVKSKETDMSFEDLKDYICDLLNAADGKCQVTGLPFSLPPDRSDPDMAASVDRIDSQIGYVRGNLQIVCWFVNRWKSDDDPENFARLINLVRNS
jgi:hypothetical protein